MPGTTTNAQLRYPVASDAPDGAGAFYNLAQDVEDRFARSAIANNGTFPGQRATVLTTINGTAYPIDYRWNGSTWRAWDSDWINLGTAGLATSNVGVTYNVCVYRYRGGKVIYRANMTVSSVGSGTILFTTPSNMDTSKIPTGVMFFSKSGTTYQFTPSIASANQVALQYQTGSPLTIANHTASAPVAPASGNTYDFEFEYDPT